MKKGFIEVKNISLEYDLEEYKINSFKEYVLSSLRKKNPPKKLKALDQINLKKVLQINSKFHLSQPNLKYII